VFATPRNAAMKNFQFQQEHCLEFFVGASAIALRDFLKLLLVCKRTSASRNVEESRRHRADQRVLFPKENSVPISLRTSRRRARFLQCFRISCTACRRFDFVFGNTNRGLDLFTAIRLRLSPSVSPFRNW